MKSKADRFARLLWAYPKSYRERRGDEILGTLLESAPTHGNLESLRLGVDVIAHGLRLRLGMASDQAGGRVVAAAALPGMTTAAAAAIVMPFFAQLLPGIRHDPTSFGLDTVVWPALHVPWVLAAVVALVSPRRTRICALSCVIATVVIGIVLSPRDAYLPTDVALFFPLALPALLTPRTAPQRPYRWFALLIGGVVLGVLGATAATSPEASFAGPGFYGMLGSFAPYVAATVFFGAAVLLVARRWIQGTALALLGVPWLFFPSAATAVFQQPTAALWQHTIGRLPLAIVASLYLVSIEIACALGIGLLGRWILHLKKAPEAVH